MSTPTLQGFSAPAKHPFVECRVWQRFPCGLETTCQPIAARGDQEPTWSAQVRDLSVGGVGVVVNRRFERGAGLAIEVPETEVCPGTTLLGRVVHTTALPGGRWLHGCAFVSRLSEDELQRLLQLGQSGSSPVQNEASSHVIQDVILEGQGNDPRRLIRRFHLNGLWPPRPGTVLKVRLGKTSADHAHVRVERCIQQAGYWHLFYSIVAFASVEIREALGHRDH